VSGARLRGCGGAVAIERQNRWAAGGSGGAGNVPRRARGGSRRVAACGGDEGRGPGGAAWPPRPPRPRSVTSKESYGLANRQRARSLAPGAPRHIPQEPPSVGDRDVVCQGRWWASPAGGRGEGYKQIDTVVVARADRGSVGDNRRGRDSRRRGHSAGATHPDLRARPILLAVPHVATTVLNPRPMPLAPTVPLAEYAPYAQRAHPPHHRPDAPPTGSSSWSGTSADPFAWGRSEPGAGRQRSVFRARNVWV
jgi:hypothetical protein